MTGVQTCALPISNYALPGHRSAHNSAYWRRVPYLGIGPSAHSFDGLHRRANEREYESWRAKCATGADPLATVEFLSDLNRAAEDVYLGLRTDGGLEVTAAEALVATPWVRSGWARVAGNRLVLSAEGWLRLDSMAAALTAERSR